MIRQVDPVRQWKLSPMDLASLDKWDEYTEAKEAMFFYTDTADAPWTVVKSNDKKRARLEAMRHVLALFDYAGQGPGDRHGAGPADRRLRRTALRTHRRRPADPAPAFALTPLQAGGESGRRARERNRLRSRVRRLRRRPWQGKLTLLSRAYQCNTSTKFRNLLALRQSIRSFAAGSGAVIVPPTRCQPRVPEAGLEDFHPLASECAILASCRGDLQRSRRKSGSARPR